MVPFEFNTPERIIFGAGAIRQLSQIVKSMSSRILCVTNLAEKTYSPILTALTKEGIFTIPYHVSSEPTISLVSEGVQICKQNNCDLIIGFGGGSAIDAGKAISALVTNPGDIVNYLEVIGKGLPFSALPIPMVAIPTTAGTGAEVTRNAVLKAPIQGVKVSLRSPLLLPKLALIDSELTIGLPPDITASTGLDALTQLIEPYVSLKSNPVTDMICREGITRVAYSLFEAYDKDDPVSRDNMSLASLLGGLALANAGLGIVHGFASVLGGMYSIPHGVICARILPAAIEVNIRALQARTPESKALTRYSEIAQLLTGSLESTASDGVHWIDGLSRKMHIPPLSAYGVTVGDISQIIDKTIVASSTKTNPIQLTPVELQDILNTSL